MNLLIRTDASPKIGSGHAMRCLALAQAAKDHGIGTTFVMNECSEVVKTRIESEGCDLQTHLPEGKHIVIDGYQFDADTQEEMKSQDRRVLFIDDFGHCKKYVSHLILNQNIYANESFYRNKSSETKLLLGLKYVLLRREFMKAKPTKKRNDALHVLITVGGFDQRNMVKCLENTLKKMDCNIRVARNATNMPELMQWADCAISAAGTTVYELAYMGVPTAMIVMADNQKLVADGMADAGFGMNLGWYKDVPDSAIRDAVVTLTHAKITPQTLINGYGSHRVLAHLFEWPLWLRPATEDDCRLLFEWANDPSTRAVSLSQEPIPWMDHKQWFQNKLQDPDCHIFIGMDQDDNPIGQIRFDRRHSAMEIDISIAESERGKGYGTSLLYIGVRRLFALTTISQVYAYIKKNNPASCRAFEKAGFQKSGEEMVKSTPVFRYYVNR